MKAIVITGKNSVAVKEVPKPEQAAPGHLIIKMKAMGINGGDLLTISGTMPPGFFPESQYAIAGVSGAGTVIETGEGVPERFKGKNVAVYRSLQFSEAIVGTWSEYVQLHYLHCVILPDSAPVEAYAGSLVNCITPFAFWQQIKAAGHKGIIATAGNSATGLALLGICRAYDFPLIAVVREAAAKKELEALGATHVLVQNEEGFEQRLQDAAQQLQATAVFDGVGGAALNTLMHVLPDGSTVYCYGFLGGTVPLSFQTRILMKDIAIQSFSNFKTATVQNPQLLEEALEAIGGIIGQPYFTTKTGRSFGFHQIEEALAYALKAGSKAMLIPSF